MTGHRNHYNHRNRVPWRLRRHLTLVIALKLIALLAIWWLFFRGELRPPADSAAVADKILHTHGAAP